MEKILITGATGFIGSFIAEEAVRRGMEVWAAIRHTSNLQYIKDRRIHKVLLDLDSEPQMRTQMRNLSFDYVVHAAGATKALNSDTFYRINTEGTKHLVNVLSELSSLNARPIKRFVYMSSLSVMGPVQDSNPHREITERDTPAPNTAYGMSKLTAEMWLKENCEIPYTILRPTGVYGPREKDYKVMIDSIRRGIDVAIGGPKQCLTFLYVSDLVDAVFSSMKSEKTIGKSYFLSDGDVYSSLDFSDYIIETLGRRVTFRPTVPLGMLRTVCAVSDMLMHITGRLSTLNNDHYNILKQRNWQCDITPAKEDFGYEPKIKLKKGVRLTIKG